MTDEQKAPEPPEGFEIVTDEYRLANGYPSGAEVRFFSRIASWALWSVSEGEIGWSDGYMSRYEFAIKPPTPPDIPTQVGAIAERCARISETTEHDALCNLQSPFDLGYLCLQVYVGGYVRSASDENYKRGTFDKLANLAADANRWLDKVLADAE